MHGFVSFVLLLVANFILVNARKLNSYNNASFSVELIHRKTPNGGGQGRLPIGSVSHHHHIRLSSAYYEGNKFVQTEIFPDGGDYEMKIKVGTPPIEFNAIADTGSDLVWIQCSPCESCFQHSPLFNPKQSSSFNIVPCSSQVCNDHEPGLSGTDCVQYDGGVSNDGACSYKTAYGGGTKTTGILSTETISFATSDASTTSFPSFIFGCGVYQEGKSSDLGNQGNGIAGLGGGPLSLVSQLGPNFNNKFSYCLTPRTSGVNSKLKFGLDVSSPGVVSTPFTKQDNAPTFYHLTLDGISVGDTSIPVANNDVIIDSGTTMTLLPLSIYDGIRTAMKGAIKLTPVPDPYQMYDPCYGDESINPPDVVFHFKGADVVLKAENTFRTINGVTCMAMVPVEENFIFGNIAQVNFEVGYDLQANKVSFAHTDCTKF